MKNARYFLCVAAMLGSLAVPLIADEALLRELRQLQNSFPSKGGEFNAAQEEERVPLGVLIISDYGQKPALSAEQIIKIIDSGNLEELRIKVNPKTINAKNKDGDTPLLYAAKHANIPAVIDILINSGAQIEIRNKEGKTPLMLAVERPFHSSIAVALIKNGADVNAVQKTGKNSVLTAALSGSAVSQTVIQALIDTGADVNFQNSQANTPLLLALKNTNSASVVNILAKAGADIEKADSDGITPLMIAIAKPSYPDLVITLIRNKADINTVYDNSMTPLMLALNNPSTKIAVIKAFIDSGADIDKQNHEGMTSLMYAAMTFDEEIIKLFKKAKADFAVKDNSGRTARDYAADNPKISAKFLKKMKK